ncbi:uncharacterized protein LOC144632393 isoform X3 [Oculina patagonica]
MNQLMFFVVAFALCVLPSGAYNEKNDCLFVSHLASEDSPYCGSSVMPCRTLPQALRLVHNGGKICLDGRNSESHPYGCLTMDSGPYAKGRIVIHKSVTVQGQFSEAHIFCDLIFATNAASAIFNVTLSNLVFNNSKVSLRDVCAFNIVITKCRFINCPYRAVDIQEDLSALDCQKSTLAVTDSEFWYHAKSIYVYLFNEFFNFTISRCLFQGRKGRYNVTSERRTSAGAVYINSTDTNGLRRMRVVGSVTDSVFRELGHEDNSFAFSVRIWQFSSDGNLTLLNTSFFNNENSVFVYGGFALRMTKLTINSTYGYAITASGPPKTNSTALGIKVFLDDCFLADNRVGVRMSTTTCGRLCSCLTSDQTLVVRNSLFLGGPETRSNDHAIRFSVQNSVLTPPQKFGIEAQLRIENVTFQGLHHCALSVVADKNISGLILVKNCKFLNNHQFVYRLDERATVQVEIQNGDPPNLFCKREGDKSSKFIWNKKSQLPMIFEDTIFEGNTGISGTLNLLNGNVTLKNCTFKNNEGVTLAGHVYMKPGYGSLNIVDSTFLQTSIKRSSNVSGYSSFLHSESTGPLIITNSTFTANDNRKLYPIFATTKSISLKVDASSSLWCPHGKQIMAQKDGFKLVEDSDTCWINMYINNIKVFCEGCPNGFYTLQRGSTSGLNINKGTECLKCPYGATCENGKIEAKENVWGFKVLTRPPSLQFIPCPLEYCKPSTRPVNYTYTNDCHGDRSGLLCGQCSDGYSEALYSTSCRKKEKCNDHWFWMASFIYVMAFALYVVFKPPIFSLLYRQCLCFRKTPERGRTQTTQNTDSSSKHDAGYLKIVFYFYQVAELVMVKSPEKTLYLVPFIPPVIALFNFQVKTMDGSIGCPFPGLNAVTKELFMCLKFLATLLSISFIYVIHRTISKSFYLPKPSLALYLAVALETLLLGYETLADTTLKLMHCVPIGQDWRLFVDGNIQCWQWWQYLFIVFIVVFVIPLVLVLFWGSLMLSKDKVSAKEFLISCAFPLPLLLIWLFRYCKKRLNGNQFELLGGNSHDTEEIKKVLHDPFRPSSNGEHGTLYWESVLSGRRFILLTIHTFCTNLMTRFVCLDCACLLIVLHHLISRPFRSRKANVCETLSLVSLVTICTFSLAEVTYISEGLEPTGPNQSFVRVLQWIEIAVLGLLPAVACILVVFAIVSQVFRALYHCVRVVRKFTARALSLQSSFRPRQVLIQWDSEELYTVT